MTPPPLRPPHRGQAWARQQLEVLRALRPVRAAAPVARALARRAWSVLPSFRDLHVYGGLVLMAVGAAMAYRPAGYFLAGLVLLWLGLRRARVTRPPGGK